MPKMTDKVMAAKARQYKTLKTAEAQAKADADKLKLELLAELKRRKLPVFEKLGVRIQHKIRTTTVYSVDSLWKRLTRKRDLFLRLITVNGKALAAAKKAGEITDDDMAAVIAGHNAGGEYIDVDILDAA